LSQSEKFDREGLFIKRWLPGLNDLDRQQVHSPNTQGGLFGAVDYPAPIVDLRESRARALAAFRNLPTHQDIATAGMGDQGT
jgi:deoxyribodipyrimidine photo-lyase